MIHQQMKKNLIIKWQQCHSVKSYQHELCDMKLSEHMKTQDIMSHEKFWWTILVFDVLYSCEIMTWRTFWIHVYVFDRSEEQIWYDTRISMIEKA